MLSTFEYSLAFISIILIIIIIMIILHKKYEDKTENENVYGNVYGNVNGDISSNISNNKENFTLQSDIIDKNTEISNLIIDINKLSNNNPAADLSVRKKEIDENLQSSIAESINTNTNNLITRVGNSNDRINNNITTLTNQISDLENIITRLNLKNIVKSNYTKIKSLNNGAEITLTQTPNTFYLDTRTGMNTAAYMVNLNNGCLSIGATDYDVYKCNEKNIKHLFKMEHVINEEGYNKHIDKSVPFNKTDLSSINYPFVLMRSVNNNNCLTNQNGNITVQPCDALISQRWLPL